MDRTEKIRALRSQGLSVSDIVEKVGVTRQTVWRHCRGLEPVPPAPTPSPTPDGHVDLFAARRVGLDTLLDRASAGSVSAASTLFKQASEQLRADRCKGHVAAEDVVKAAMVQFDLWVAHLTGPLCRRLLLEYDLDPGQVEGLINDSISDITKELNARFQAEDNHE